MKLTLTEDDGIVIDEWNSNDELDLGVFYNLCRMEDEVTEVTRVKLRAHIDEQVSKLHN